MARTILLLVMMLTGALSEISAQQLTPPQQATVDRLFKTNPEVHFYFNVRSLQEIPHFAKVISVDNAQGIKITAHADKAQFTKFIRMNIPYTVISKAGKPLAKPKTETASKKK